MAKKLILKRALPLLLILMLCMSMTTVAMAYQPMQDNRVFFYYDANPHYEGAVVTNLQERNYSYVHEYDGYGNGGLGMYYAYLPDDTKAPSCEGYLFRAWSNYSAAGYPTHERFYLPGDLAPSTSSMKYLYARWEKAYNFAVNYDVNGGEVGSAPTGSEVPNAAAPYTFVVKYKEPTREGYVFTGWNTAADGSGTAYAPGDSLTLQGNGGAGKEVATIATTLYAQWAEDTGGQEPGGSGIQFSQAMCYVLHAYYLDGVQEYVSDNGQPVFLRSNDAIADLEKKTAYNGNSYTYTGYDVQELETYGEASHRVTLRYDRSSPIPTMDVKLTYHANLSTNDTTVVAISETLPNVDTVNTTTLSPEFLGISAGSSRSFQGWNTASDGSGTGYAVGSAITLSAAAPTLDLYAQWKGVELSPEVQEPLAPADGIWSVAHHYYVDDFTDANCEGIVAELSEKALELKQGDNLNTVVDGLTKRLEHTTADDVDRIYAYVHYLADYKDQVLRLMYLRSSDEDPGTGGTDSGDTGTGGDSGGATPGGTTPGGTTPGGPTGGATPGTTSGDAGTVTPADPPAPATRPVAAAPVDSAAAAEDTEDIGAPPAAAPVEAGADKAADAVELPEEEVPLAAEPAGGNGWMLWLFAALLAGGVAIFLLSKRLRKAA